MQKVLRYYGSEKYEVGWMDRWDQNASTEEQLLTGTELDNHYFRYHADKTRRIKERGTKSCITAPEAMDGAIELLEEL
jgi:hypothetical protein